MRHISTTDIGDGITEQPLDVTTNMTLVGSDMIKVLNITFQDMNNSMATPFNMTINKEENTFGNVTQIQHATSNETDFFVGNVTQLQNATSNETDYYYYYYYMYESVPVPHKEQIYAEWQATVLGYVYFIIGIATIIVNLLVFCVFLWKRIKTPTSVVLSVLAVSNALICLSQIPSAMYLYIMKNYLEFVPHDWCVARHVLYIAHQIARNASNWLTATLGIQRSIIVCYPFQAKRYCSMKNTLIAIVIICLVSIGLFINEAVAVEITPMEVLSTSGHVFDGCSRNFPQWYVDNVGDMKQSVIANYVSVGVLTRLLPCIVLSVTTIILTYKLVSKKDDLSSQAMNTASAERRVRRVTVLVFLIMIIFLVAELQDVIAFAIYVYEIATDKMNSVLSRDQDKAWMTIGNIMWLLGYHFNSWIFFFMSGQFRTAFRDMYVPNRFIKQERDLTTGVSFLKASRSKVSQKNSSHMTSGSQYSSSPESRKFLTDEK